MAQDLRENGLFTYKPDHELLDDVNLQLLKELQQEPRLTMTELGRRVAMSAPAVTERVRRMEEAGIILGYRLDTWATHHDLHTYSS
jgi:Lrp/AsnC family transcriptional regulator, leucine-responsive regulatory protein